MERTRSYAQYGDFTTPATSVRSLGAFTRTLNGGLAHFETGHLAVGGFATEGRSHQVVDEFPGQGISGPYVLSRTDGTLGSETVEILVRDRTQTLRILRRERKDRYTDYTLEPFTGRLLFRQPVPSVDSDLNPVSIRVTYEVESGGEKFWVYGGEARLSPVRGLELGGSAARDEDPAASRGLLSGDATLRLTQGVTLIAEVARSDSGRAGFAPDSPHGHAGRAELRVAEPWLEARVHALRVGENFDNPSAGVTPGRQDLGFTARAPLGNGTSAFVEGLRSEDLVGHGRIDGVSAGLAGRPASGVSTELAYRWANETRVPLSELTAGVTPSHTNSVRGKFTTEVPHFRRATAFGEYEQDLNETQQRRAAVGGDVRVAARTRLYLRHENIASFGGPWALNAREQGTTTVFGAASDELREGYVFSEYRARDAFGGREVQAAIGLRNRWRVSDGVRLDGSVERLTSLRGQRAEATSITGGIEAAGSPQWKGTARVEYRTQLRRDEWLTTGGLARKLGRDWAALARTSWSVVPVENRVDEQSQIGFAYRQTTRNAWNALARYENRFEQASTGGGFQRIANIVSGHANWKVSRPLTLSGQIASKWGVDDHSGIISNTDVHLVGGRALADLTRWLDFGLTGRGLFSSNFASRQMGAGAELGFSLVKNLRLAAGYNVFGFRDDDMIGEERTDRGPYASFGLKLDEDLFGLVPRAAPAPESPTGTKP